MDNHWQLAFYLLNPDNFNQKPASPRRLSTKSCFQCSNNSDVLKTPTKLRNTKLIIKCAERPVSEPELLPVWPPPPPSNWWPDGSEDWISADSRFTSMAPDVSSAASYRSSVSSPTPVESMVVSASPLPLPLAAPFSSFFLQNVRFKFEKLSNR